MTNSEAVGAAPAGGMTKLEKQLRYMFRCMWGERDSPDVQVGYTVSNLAYADAVVDQHGPVRLLEQNPRTSSIFASGAQEGIKIAWLFYQGTRDYVGPVVADVPGIGLQVYWSGSDLRAVLNPVAEIQR